MEDRKNMGLGSLGRPDIIFLRKFRFTLEGEHLKEDYNYSVRVDWFRQIIKFSAYEVFTPEEGIHIWNWADAMQKGEFPKETLTLKAYDGCGAVLFAKKFSGLEIISRENNFDYSSSEAVMHELTLQYQAVTNLKTGDVEKPAAVEEVPLQVNHLNERIWVK